MHASTSEAHSCDCVDIVCHLRTVIELGTYSSHKLITAIVVASSLYHMVPLAAVPASESAAVTTVKTAMIVQTQQGYFLGEMQCYAHLHTTHELSTNSLCNSLNISLSSTSSCTNSISSNISSNSPDKIDSRIPSAVQSTLSSKLPASYREQQSH